jgi:DNA-directed RNA polymerase specialized sigma24 family protein
VHSLGDVEPASPGGAADATFQQEWLLNLIEHCLERLRADHPNYHQALRLTLFEEKTRAEVAALMGRSEVSVRNWVHRGRRKLISYVREEAWGYSGTSEAYREELSYLSSLMGERVEGNS